MKCKEVQSRIVDFLTGECSDRDVHGIRIHLEQCVECRKSAGEIKTILNASKRIKSPEFPEEFWKANMGIVKLRAENTLSFPLRRIVIGLCAAVIISAVLFVSYIHRPMRYENSSMVSFAVTSPIPSEEDLLEIIDTINESDAEKILQIYLANGQSL